MIMMRQPLECGCLEPLW